MLVNEQWTYPFLGPFQSLRSGQMSALCGRTLAHSED